MTNGDDFRQMFMRLSQSVLAGCQEICRLFSFISGYHLFAAATVPGKGKGSDGIVSRHDSRCRQRLDKRNDAAGMTSRIANAAAMGNHFALLRR